MPSQGPSSGPKTRTPSSPPSGEGTKRWIPSTYLLIPGVGRGSSGGVDEALDVTTGFLIQARDGPAPGPVFALARRERRAHPCAVGTGAGADGAGRGVGSQA